MIIYFYLLITLKILTVESSSIRSGNLKNDLVSLLSSRTDLGRKDSNSLKIISQEPFIIQLGVNNGSENVRIKDIKDESRERQERKKKRPAKRRLSKLKSLRKKHRIRRDVKASDYKKTSAGDERKYNQTDRLITDEVAKNLLVNITSKRLEQGNTIKRKELFQALTQAINETQQEIKQRNSTEEDIDRQWLKTQVDTKQSSHHHHQPISTSNSTPFVRMVHQLPRKTDKNQSKQTYKDLMADRDRLEQKIKSLKNLVNSNDTKLTDDGTRVRRKSELDKVNKMAKMFLTLSAVNGINDRKKFKCKEEEEDDDDGGDLWAEERKSNPLKRTSSTNEERYKVKKWIEHLKSKRSSRSCPCQNGGRGEDETDVFPLELKLSKDPSLRDFGENSEESSEGYRGRFLDYPKTRSGFYKPRNPINYEDPDNKLSVLSRRGRKFDLPFEDLEVYRSRAKQILQNAEEILDRIKEEEEKRRNTPTCLANHLKELTSKIQGDPRNSENDLIRVLHKALGWNPLTKPEGPNEGAKEGEGSFLDGLKWSIMDPYEKAKALTEENTRQLSSYLLRNLGKIGGQSGEQPEQQVQESKPKEPAADENTQIYHGQVPQDKDSVLLFGDLRKENDPNQPEQGTDVTLTPMEPEIKDGLMATDTVKEPIKDKIKEILEEQGKKIEEFAEKQSEGEESSHEQPESNKKFGSDETKSVPMEPYEKSINKYHTEGDYEEVINQDEGLEATKHEAEDTKVEALNPKESDEKGEDEVRATEGKDNSEGEDDPTDTTQDDKVEAANSREDSKKTDDEVEALKSKDNSEGENSTDLNQDKVEAASDEGKDDNVEAMNPKENREDDEKEEVEAIENRDNSEGNEDPGNVNEDDKVEARNSKESPDQTDGLNPEKVETAEDKEKSERNEESVDIKQDDKVQAVNSGENSENTDDEVEAPEVRYNSEGDEDPTDTDQDDKVEGQNLKGSSEKSEDEDMETIEGRNNTEGDKDTTDINEEDKVEGIRSRGNSEDTEDEEVEAMEGKENDEEGEDPTEISEDDQVEGKNSRTSNEKTDDEDVEAIEDRNDTEGDEDPTEISEDDKVEAKENLENDEELTEPNEQVEASKPLESLKKNFENVDSDEKTEDYKNKDEEVKLENEKERSSEDGDTETRQKDDSGEETDDFINRETPKATSIEDEETQQTQDENDVIGSPHLSKSEEQEDQTKSDVTGTSDPENSEISKLSKEEDLTVAEPGPTGLEESSEVKPKDNEEDENTDKESQEKGNEGIVAAENTEPKKESNEDNKDEEQTPEKDLTAAEHSTYSQENKSEESDDPQTGKTSNTDEDSDVKERDDNDLIASKHLSKAKGQLEETTEELKDNNDTDDNLTKERVSKTDDITPTQESTESESSSKENYDDNDQVGSEKPGKLVSTENDKSKSLESHEGANVPDDKDSKIVSVPENHDKTLDAESQKTDGEDAVRAGLAKVIDGILGKEESWPNEEKEDDSKNDMIQSAPTTDESPTNEDIVEQPNETDDETSRETKPLLTWGKKEEQDQNTDPKSANTSDELTKSSEHDPESTSRTNIVNDDDWSVETAIQEKTPKLNKYKYISELGSNPMEDNSESEENFDYENLADETLRAAEPIQDNRNIVSSGELQNEENLGVIHSQPKTGKTVKLSVPRSVGDVIKDLNDGKIKYDEDMSSLDPEKIDYFIGKIDKAEQDEQANEKSQEVDCRKECACADEIDTRSRKIGRYEIVKDILHWMKDLQINRVLSDD